MYCVITYSLSSLGITASLIYRSKDAQARAIASQLTRALDGVGFLYIANVEGFVPDELLRATKWFFSLPLEKRLATAPKQWNPASKNTYRGYFPIVAGRYLPMLPLKLSSC